MRQARYSAMVGQVPVSETGLLRFRHFPASPPPASYEIRSLRSGAFAWLVRMGQDERAQQAASYEEAESAVFDTALELARGFAQ